MDDSRSLLVSARRRRCRRRRRRYRPLPLLRSDGPTDRRRRRRPGGRWRMFSAAASTTRGCLGDELDSDHSLPVPLGSRSGEGSSPCRIRPWPILGVGVGFTLYVGRLCMFVRVRASRCGLDAFYSRRERARVLFIRMAQEACIL